MMQQQPTIHINRDEVLATVRQNRDEHRAIFLEAQQKYRERVIELLDQRLAEVRDGRPIVLAFNLPEPVDYTESYNEAIAALEWETRDVIEMDQRTFRQLVLNKWEWAGLFAANTQSYVEGA